MSMLMSLFRAITDRLKALFASNAAMELESEFLAREAERRAELHRQADRYDAEGLRGIAQHLRQRADTLLIERPLANTLPAIEHLLGTNGQADLPLLNAPATNSTPERNPKTMISNRTKKKGR
jgi:hypothetical protein